MGTPAARTNELILAFLRLLWKPGDVREFRSPKYKPFNTLSGYFDSPDKLADALAPWDRQANLFVTLNPVNPALLARASNRIAERAEHTTSDQDVLHRDWLFVDIDPIRPSGISSTDSESAAAFEVLNSVVGFLTSQSWPAPLTAKSGNGYYALYRVDLPNDSEATALLKSVLETLASRFNTDKATLDTTVHNAGRIIGVVGSLKMKGDPTEDRPHRRSEILSAPDEIGVVSIELLTAVASPMPSPSSIQVARTTSLPARPLTEILDSHQLEYRPQPPDANGVTWYHVRRCPFHEDGKDFECGVGQKLPDGPYAGHGFHPECNDKGWQDWKRALDLLPSSRVPPLLSKTQAETKRPTDFPRTDTGNAELFAHSYAGRLLHDHRRHHWLRWNEHRWEADDDGAVFRLATDAVRQRYLDAMLIPDLDERSAQAKFATVSENRQRLEAMLALARNQSALSDAGDRWDHDAYLLGVANGVVDLRDGSLLAGTPQQRITRFTNIKFDTGQTCPRWLQFLDEVFAADTELIAFIQKAIGYSLTGDTSEQCVFTCYGTGSNGKSVLLRVLRALAGRYAYNAGFSLFELQNRSAITNDVAPLAGARLVTSSETNEGTRLNEARLKALTGNDPITARYLYGENFTFYPEAKFWLAINHRPRVTDDSFGFWRRMRLIPFTRTFDADKDKNLEARLDRELPGILAWAIQGCLLWQREGLTPPAAVTVATETYRIDSDPLRPFLEECCVQHQDARTGASDLYVAYSSWSAKRSMKESERLSSTAFGAKLSERFPKRRGGKGVVYVGLGLLCDSARDQLSPTEVQGSVQGFESDAGSRELSSLVEVVTREEPEKAYTTLHPTQADPGGEPCRGGCGKQVPAGQKCHACASRATTAWARQVKSPVVQSEVPA